MEVMKQAAVGLSIVAAVAFMGDVAAQEHDILATFKGAIGAIPVSNNGAWSAAAIPKLDDVHLEISRLMEEGL